MSDTSRPLYVISVVAEITGLHPQTLRNYERAGLISPVRTKGGARRFSDKDLALLSRIHELASVGMNMAAITRIIALEHRVIELENRLRSDIEAVHRSYRRDLVPLFEAKAPANQNTP
jgi:MerR family transcriptional regulator/heat shock protein HspR